MEETAGSSDRGSGLRVRGLVGLHLQGKVELENCK